MAHRGEHRVVLLRRSCGVTRAPQALQAASTARTLAAGFSGSGASTTRRPRNSSALAAAAPLFSAPAIGCAGTNWAIFAPSAARAAATTSRLVLPASVTIAAGLSCGASAAEAPAGTAPPASRPAPGRRPRRCAHRRDRIDDAALERELQVGGAAADARRRAPQRLACLERQRERAADQPDADTATLSKQPHHSFRLAASAPRNLSFSAAVPTVTRRCSGSW